ncbi:MAG TPA: hypothetical protein VM943_10400 [Pyrinomonadaceae bacterium]|nr:hypothetical protein [Pyrinomonadaceae bacterium]
MNCQLFETVVIDLARSSVTDAAARESELNHAETCARCATRLAGERALTAGLRSAAAVGTEANVPSPRLEAALLAAFRAQNEVPAPRANLYAFTPRTSRRQVYAIAAAVVIAVFIGLIGLNLLRSSQSLRVEQANSTPEKITPSPAPQSVEPMSSANQVAAISESGDEIRTARLSFPPRIKRTGSDSLHRRAARPRAGAQMLPASTIASANAGDIMTEYMPLAGGGSLSGMEGGQIVRVEVPRSALASFGLPMNAERAGERVKADVVLGYDGVARAIRFVR